MRKKPRQHNQAAAERRNGQVPPRPKRKRAVREDAADERTEEWRPRWSVSRRELSLSGQVIKRLRRRADMLDRLLAAFEEEGWPERLDNPLPGEDAQEQKERLHNAITTWNRRPESGLRLLFERDGTGEGILWIVVEE